MFSFSSKQIGFIFFNGGKKWFHLELCSFLAVFHFIFVSCSSAFLLFYGCYFAFWFFPPKSQTSTLRRMPLGVLRRSTSLGPWSTGRSEVNAVVEACCALLDLEVGVRVVVPEVL